MEAKDAKIELNVIPEIRLGIGENLLSRTLLAQLRKSGQE